MFVTALCTTAKYQDNSGSVTDKHARSEAWTGCHPQGGAQSCWRLLCKLRNTGFGEMLHRCTLMYTCAHMNTQEHTMAGVHTRTCVCTSLVHPLAHFLLACATLDFTISERDNARIQDSRYLWYGQRMRTF